MLKIFAPAKINLHLHVTGKRADGYHLLDSLVCFADIGDNLIFQKSDRTEFEITGPFGTGLDANDNSIVKAARLLSQAVSREPRIKITLEKNLPLGAGIGGGSADAAACLWGLCQIWDLNLPEDFLQEIALKIGADVPVCLKSQPVIMRGIGEVLSPAPDLPELPAILIWPNCHAATPSVFKSLNLESFSSQADLKPVYQDTDALIADLTLKTRNDLEAPARSLYPVITDALEILQQEKDCRLARMSGSGSTVFGIFEDELSAVKAAQAIQAQHPEWWVRPCWLNRTARY